MIKYIKEFSKGLSIKAGILAGILMLVITPLFVTSHADAMTSNAQNLAGLIAVDNTVGNNGSFTDNDDLADLIVLGGLFPTSTNASTNAKNLAGLIAVDNVTGGSSGGAFTSSNDDLASLLVLNGLFLDP